jgi:hypothetical protein
MAGLDNLTLCAQALALVMMAFVAILLSRRNTAAGKEMAALKESLAAAGREASSLKEEKGNIEKELAGAKAANEVQVKRIEDLKTALNSNSFDGRFPICSNCKDIRDENGCWHSIEEFIASLSEADFSHSLCPDCARKLYPEMFEEGRKLHTLTWK